MWSASLRPRFYEEESGEKLMFKKPIRKDWGDHTARINRTVSYMRMFYPMAEYVYYIEMLRFDVPKKYQHYKKIGRSMVADIVIAKRERDGIPFEESIEKVIEVGNISVENKLEIWIDMFGVDKVMWVPYWWNGNKDVMEVIFPPVPTPQNDWGNMFARVESTAKNYEFVRDFLLLIKKELIDLIDDETFPNILRKKITNRTNCSFPTLGFLINQDEYFFKYELN